MIESDASFSQTLVHKIVANKSEKVPNQIDSRMAPMIMNFLPIQNYSI